MAEPVVAEVSGLQTSNNTFSASPPGALSVADNCVMPQKGVVEPRRGQLNYKATPTAASVPLAMAMFQDAVVASLASDKSSTSYELGYYTGSGNFSTYTGTFNPVDTAAGIRYGRMKFGYGGGYLYFCTETGPLALEDVTDEPRSAGLLRMPDCAVLMESASALGTDGVGMDYLKSRAYRTLLRRPTSDGVSLLSPPSGRFVVSNRIVAEPGAMTRSGGTTVTVTMPGADDPGLDVGDSFDLTPGEADFPAGTYTVATVTNNVFTYASAGGNVSNTVTQDFDTGPRPTLVYVFLPDDATTDTPVRIYRSLDSTTTSPSDEMFLVNEVFPSGGDIAAGYLTYTDITPESVISDPLYTNPQTGEGPTQSNNQPPLYRDIGSWGQRTWYANTTGLQTLQLQMLGVGAPDGIQDGDTLTITMDGETSSPFTFTFKNTPAAPGDVGIISNGTPSFNISQTIQGLRVSIQQTLNQGLSWPLTAYCNSEEDEAPGKLLMQTPAYDAVAFSVDASRQATWVPALEATSDNDRQPNGLAYSKLGQAEAVPPVNYLQIGAKNFPIQRVIGLQNALLVFKDGDGIYSVTGNFPFQVLQISTANIIAPDACALFADAAWAYTDQGILRVSDSGGATVVSRPIEVELNALRTAQPLLTQAYSFAVAYETERRIMFFVPFSASAVSPFRPVLKAYCYNNATQAWTGPNYINAFSGVVKDEEGGNNDRLLLGMFDYDAATGRVTIERRTGTVGDMADLSSTNTLVAIPNTSDASIDGVVVNLSSLDGVSVGDGITQGTNCVSTIAALRPDVGPNCVEVYETMPWALGSCATQQHYDVTVQFQPSGNPTARKAMTRLAWIFKPGQFRSFAGLSTLLTDQIQADEEIDTPSLGFGSNTTADGGGFGVTPFGDPTPLVVDVNPLDPAHTNAAQFFPGIKLSEVRAKMRLQGFSMTLETADGPAGRGK